MGAIPTNDLAKDVQDLDLSKDERTLGICWNLISDLFTFRVQGQISSQTAVITNSGMGLTTP